MSKPLIILVGASGSGKSTIANKLERKYGYISLKSYTTRAMRNDPNDALTHTFISPDRVSEFKNDIIVDTIFNGAYYFATQKQLDTSDTYIVDKKGLIELKKKYHNREIISIYLDVSPEIVAKRMEQRGDSDEVIMKRLQHDAGAFEGTKELCDFICPNNNQDQQYDIVEFIHKLIEYKAV